MYPEKVRATVEDIQSVADMPELDALWKDLASGDHAEYAEHPDVAAAYSGKKEQLGNLPAPEPIPAKDELAAMLEELALLRRQVAERPAASPRPTSKSKYRLLSTDVSWATKPQIHAMMKVLSSVADVGDVVDEEDIVEAMELNRHVLCTRQSGRRIWNYYKGRSDNGLMMHGNVEKVP